MSKAPYDKKNPFSASVSENRLLNKEGSIKETRHFSLNIAGSDLVYSCGDSLGVFPANRVEEVDELLSVLKLNGDEKILVPRETEEISIKQALTNKFALAGPTKKFLNTVLEKVTDAAEKESLENLLKPDLEDVLKDYLFNRHFVDILKEYPSAKFSAQEFVGSLRKLVPRLYSIASSPTQFPHDVHLTIAIVRYNTLEKERVGVASTYLADRVSLNEPDVPVFVAKSHFGLPEDDSKDIIMVGPGTGVAPFRSFLQERIARKASGRSWLFFGDQHKNTDYLYEEEFEAMLVDGNLNRISLAWSRDQGKKVYVQNKMLEEKEELWNWISNGAYFYVCGDKSRMAPDVDAALHQVAQEFGKMSEEEAVTYIKALKKEKRYLRDVY